MFWNAKHISQGKRTVPFVFAIVNTETDDRVQTVCLFHNIPDSLDGFSMIVKL